MVGKEINFLLDTREQQNPKHSVPIEQIVQRVAPMYERVCLKAGDFSVYDENGRMMVIVERKAMLDFINSVYQGRLESQINKMEVYNLPVFILISGSLPTAIRKLKELKRPVIIDAKRIRGEIASLSLRHGFHVMWFQSDDELVEQAYRICKGAAEGKYMTPRNRAKKFAKPIDALRIVANDNVSSLLLSEFLTLHRIAEASVKDLQSIKGIGPHVAQRVHDYFNE